MSKPHRYMYKEWRAYLIFISCKLINMHGTNICNLTFTRYIIFASIIIKPQHLLYVIAS